MVIIDLFGKDAVQVVLVEADQGIETLLTDRTDPTVGIGGCFRSANRCFDDRDAFGLEHRIEDRRILAIAITNQVLHWIVGLLEAPKEVPSWLVHPRRDGMSGHPGAGNPARSPSMKQKPYNVGKRGFQP